MLSEQLLSILACPETRQPLLLLSEEKLKLVNKHIQDHKLANKKGERIKQPLQAGLIREDQKVVYPILDEIPILLIEEGIELSGANQPSA